MRSSLPPVVHNLIQELIRLPEIGPKTARRLALYLLHQPLVAVKRLAQQLLLLHSQVRICTRCCNLADQELCVICHDPLRDLSTICLVADALDVDAIERSGAYHGVYHVLNGLLSPLDGVGVEQLTFRLLFSRLELEKTKELIIALDPTTEGEATAWHVIQQLRQWPGHLTRLARGLPTGGDIEFADALTLSAALVGRKKLTS